MTVGDAEIIDRETGAGELLKALEAIQLKIGAFPNGDIYGIAKAAIAKDRGRQ